MNAMEFEKTLMDLLNEYLGKYFDGQEHTLQAGLNTAKFPSVILGFQQTTMPTTLEGAHIGIVLQDPGVMRQRQVGGKYQGFANIVLEFYIRAQLKVAPANGMNAEHLCRTVSDCLFALLLDRGASIPLQEKGITRIRPKVPRVINGTHYQMRQLFCFSQCLFVTPASFGTTSNLGGD